MGSFHRDKKTDVWYCDICKKEISKEIIFQPSFYGEKVHDCKSYNKARGY